MYSCCTARGARPHTHTRYTTSSCAAVRSSSSSSHCSSSRSRVISCCSANHHTHHPNAVITHSADFVVVGTGIAGLTHALRVANFGKVAVLSKGTAGSDGSTAYAQGGVCAALAPTDSPQKHAHDTLLAGSHVNDPVVVDVVCQEGPELVLELAEFGAQFTRMSAYDDNASDEQFHLCTEGGHSQPRVVHAQDATGAEISRALLERVKSHPNITLHDRHAAVALVTSPDRSAVAGIDCLAFDDDEHSTTTLGKPVRFAAPCVCLATGGCGQIYPITTNPAGSTGDGVALATALGAVTDGMEFVQFHPTALAAPPPPGEKPTGRAFLVSEAVRGAGAKLVDANGDAVCRGGMGDLAPRDQVARDIYAAITRQMSDSPAAPQHVFLDAQAVEASGPKGKGGFALKFPTIDAELRRRGIDVSRGDLIPVAPACHYQCGGVCTDLDGRVLGTTSLRVTNMGRTRKSKQRRSRSRSAGRRASGEERAPERVLVHAHGPSSHHRHAQPIAGLFAAGECSSTGLHGANRLASNSLLEGLVFGKRAADAAKLHLKMVRAEGVDVGELALDAPWPFGFDVEACPGEVDVAKAVEESAMQVTAELQALMMSHCGIVRTTRGLLRAAEGVQELGIRLSEIRASGGAVASRVLALVECEFLHAYAREVVNAALHRRENRGLHYNVDHCGDQTEGLEVARREVVS
ncbi:L-aspartate oxidase [Pycnococcus provasolii]